MLLSMRFCSLPTSCRTDKPGSVVRLNFYRTVSSITYCKRDLNLCDQSIAVMTITEMLKVETTAGCVPKHKSATPNLRQDTTESLNSLSLESEPMYRSMGDITVLHLANALVIHFADIDHLLHSTHFLVSYSLATAVPWSGFPRSAPFHHARETLHLMRGSNTHSRTGFCTM